MTSDQNWENKSKILLVEDNPVDIDLTQRAFKKQLFHCTVDISRDGEEANQAIQRWEEGLETPPDLILMDLKMPRMDGFDVLKILRQSPKSCRIPVIILTSSNEETDISTAYQLGANSYLLKPIDYSKFVSLIQMIIQYWLELNCKIKY
jgi:CheY-like chemotaxis protein